MIFYVSYLYLYILVVYFSRIEVASNLFFTIPAIHPN